MKSEPHCDISCQDLLRDDPESHSGWLHKKWLKKLTNKFKMAAKIVPWRHYYVVLSRGNLYQYNNDMASKPSSCYSLYGYTRVIRANEVPQSEKPWAFKLSPVPGYPKHEMIFSASSEREQKRWMTEMKKQLMLGNGKGFKVSKNSESGGGSADSCSITAIEESVYDDPQDFDGRGGPSADGESSDSDYNEIEDTDDIRTSISTRRPLPPVPSDLPDIPNSNKSSSSRGPPPVPRPQPPPPQPSQTSPQTETPTRNRPPPPLPSPNPRVPPQRPPPTPDPVHSPMSPQPGLVNQLKEVFNNKPVLKVRPDVHPKPRVEKNEMNSLPSPPPRPSIDYTRTQEVIERECFWTGADKEEANRIISEANEDGVYLIRVHDPDNKVLVVFAEGAPRKYKITHHGSDLGITKDSVFPTLAALINHYHGNTLPSRPIRLVRGYRQIP